MWTYDHDYHEYDEELDYAYCETDTWDWWKFWFPMLLLALLGAAYYAEEWYTRPPKAPTVVTYDYAAKKTSYGCIGYGYQLKLSDWSSNSIPISLLNTGAENPCFSSDQDGKEVLKYETGISGEYWIEIPQGHNSIYMFTKSPQNIVQHMPDGKTLR